MTSAGYANGKKMGQNEYFWPPAIKISPLKREKTILSTLGAISASYNVKDFVLFFLHRLFRAFLHAKKTESSTKKRFRKKK